MAVAVSGRLTSSFSISADPSHSSIAIASCSSPRNANKYFLVCATPVVSRTVNIFPSIETMPSTDGGANGSGVGSTYSTIASTWSSSTASKDAPICITRTFRVDVASELLDISALTNLGYNASPEQTNEAPGVRWPATALSYRRLCRKSLILVSVERSVQYRERSPAETHPTLRLNSEP